MNVREVKFVSFLTNNLQSKFRLQFVTRWTCDKLADPALGYLSNSYMSRHWTDDDDSASLAGYSTI
jgi:hypothetical protein